MVNRINQAGTGLYDLGWLKKISYSRNTVTNFAATRIKANGDYANYGYGQVLWMTMSQIMNSSNRVSASFAVFINKLLAGDGNGVSVTLSGSELMALFKTYQNKGSVNLAPIVAAHADAALDDNSPLPVTDVMLKQVDIAVRP